MIDFLTPSLSRIDPGGDAPGARLAEIRRAHAECAMPETRMRRMVDALEWPMAILAVLVIPVLVIEEKATTPEIRQGAVIVNWVIWIAFAGEFVARWLADGTRSFPRRAWFDLLLIAITPPIGVPEAMQGIRSLRVLRLLRLISII